MDPAPDDDRLLVNRLASSRSPYLRAHAGQPIAWQPWDRPARELARRLDRPILLSAGYAACHWCHVMARECFADPTIAALVNEGFVPIKLDREEHPQVDAFHQLALAFLGVAGGWPLTMFLLPDGRPFAGGTYFPPVPRAGQPGFVQVLARISEIWRESREQAEQAAAALMSAIECRQPGPPTGPARPAEEGADPLKAALPRLLGEVDRLGGGLGRAPKFPQVPVLRLLWRARRWSPAVEPDARSAVLDAIRAMVTGGIHDHLGGGFARYAVDRDWRVPHFEKMLYDNAELLALLTEVAQTRPFAWIARTAERMVAWAQREMWIDDLGFAAALDADSEGREGAFYLWERAELEEALGRDFSFFSRFHELPRAGHLDGRIILNRRPRPPWQTDEREEARLARLYERLRLRREGRTRPDRDDKVIGAWNGLMIAALSDAGRIFGRPEWIALAGTTFDALLGALRDGEGRLHRHVFRRCRGPRAGLEDHAALARAGLALYNATGTARFIRHTAALAQQAHERFHDRVSGLYHLGDGDGLPLSPLSESDGPSPGGSAMLLEVFDALALLDETGPWKARAEALSQALTSIVATRHPLGVAGMIAAFEGHRCSLHVTIFDPSSDSDPTARVLAEAAMANLPPGAVLVRREGKAPAQAVLCVGTICGPPFEDPAELTKALRKEAGA